MTGRFGPLYNERTMSDYDGVLIENIWHELKAIREGYASLAHVPSQLESIEQRLDRMEAKSGSLEVWLRDHDKLMKSHDRTMRDHDRLMRSHDRRITKLEAA